VTRQHIGHVENIHQTLYDMTRQMMDAMNVELEYQIRRSLRDWLAPANVAPAAVQRQPLETPNAPPGPAPATGAVPPPIPLRP
jgi:hypothetical protein